MGRLKNIRVIDPVLTKLARGYKNAELISRKLFPVVLHDNEAGRIPQFSKEAFKEYNTERGLRGKSNRMNPDGLSQIEFVMKEYDLEYPIDYRESEEAMLPIEQHAVNTLQKIIQLQVERLAADLAQNEANYPTGNKITLGSDDKFDAYDTSDPIAVIETGKDAIRSKTGSYPNTVVFGAKSFKSLKNHPKIIERIKYSMKGVITIELLQEILDIENIFVGKAVKSDDAGNFSDIWQDNAILAYVPSNSVSYDDPSFGYTLRKRGKPEIDKYTDNGKVNVVRNTDILVPKIVGPEAGYLIKGTNS